LAVRRETIRSQFTEAIGRELEQDEQVVAGAFTVSGPNPMLGLAIGVVSMLLMGMRYYYLAITDRRVILMRASMLSSRPAGLAFADPRSGVQFTDVKTAAVWSSLRYCRPDGKRLRLNFHRAWRDDMQAVVNSLTAVTAPPGQ